MPSSERPRFGISTDSLGPFGDLESLHKVWDPSFGLTAVEAIGWKVRLDSDLCSAAENGLEIVCIHGRPGQSDQSNSPSDTLKLAFIKPFLQPTERLLAKYGQTYEILFHNPEIGPTQLAAIALTHQAKPQGLKLIWIENHPSGTIQLDEATTIAKDLQFLGVPVGVMFDIVHCLGPENLKSAQVGRFWDRALEKIEQIREAYQPVGLHLSIGQEEGDSFPLPKDSHLTPSMFTDLWGVILEGGITDIRFESQWSVRDYLAHSLPLAKARHLETVRRHHDWWLNFLVASGWQIES